MKYNEAKAMGLAMGLSQPAEFINSVLLHAMNIFPYSAIEHELDELIGDCPSEVVFSKACGHAMVEEDGLDDNQLCYICRKLKSL